MLSAPAHVGEQLADVAQARRAQEGVGTGVRDHVGVAVTRQRPVAGVHHTAQHQRALEVVDEGVDVEALPHPDPHQRPSRIEAATARSSGSVTFTFHRSPCTGR